MRYLRNSIAKEQLNEQSTQSTTPEMNKDLVWPRERIDRKVLGIEHLTHKKDIRISQPKAAPAEKVVKLKVKRRYYAPKRKAPKKPRKVKVERRKKQSLPQPSQVVPIVPPKDLEDAHSEAQTKPPPLQMTQAVPLASPIKAVKTNVDKRKKPSLSKPLKKARTVSTQNISFENSTIDSPKIMFIQSGRGRNTLIKTIRQLGGKTVSAMNSNPTHLVTEDLGCYSETDVLVALLRGVPIVTKEWILQSKKSGKWIAESNFLCRGVPNCEVMRKTLLEDFQNSTVGLLGLSESDIEDVTAMLSVLQCNIRPISSVSRRNSEDLEIVILGSEKYLALLKQYSSRIETLRSVLTIDTLKSVIWEGNMSVYKELHGEPRKLEKSSVQRVPKETPFGIPYLREISRKIQGTSKRRDIFPVTRKDASLSDVSRLPPVRVGRSESKCDFVLTDDGISRVHFQIFLEQKNNEIYLCIEDQESTNGLFVNDIKKIGKTILKENDTILIGGGAGIPAETHIDQSMEPDYSVKFKVQIHRSSLKNSV